MNNNAIFASATMALPKALELIISEIDPSRQGVVREQVAKEYFNGLLRKNNAPKAANCCRTASYFASANSHKTPVVIDKPRECSCRQKKYDWPADTELRVGALVKLPIPRNGHSELAGWKVIDYSLEGGGCVKLACETQKEIKSVDVSMFHYIFAESIYAMQKSISAQ